MPNHLTRVLSASTLALAALAPLALSQDTPQPCDGKPVKYTAPAGSVLGYGTTPSTATDDAETEAIQIAMYSVTGCDRCPDGSKCASQRSLSWSGTVVGIAEYDTDLNLWFVGRTWTACTITQTCESCE
ncbi:MAG: hypothetical protein AAF682_31590 [Planctomycetota bacterium]